MEFRTRTGQMSVTFICENIVCIAAGPGRAIPQEDGISILPNVRKPVVLKKTGTAKRMTISSSRLTVQMEKESGILSFLSDGRKLLSEDGRRFPRVDGYDGKFCAPEQRFRIPASDALYGLGQHQQGVMNWRGHDVLLRQTNTGSGLPFLVSTGGWAIFWDSPSVTRFKEKDGTMSFRAEAGECVRYFLIAGNDIDELIRGYRILTGAAPMFPKWACGYWQSKERYESGKELLDVVTRFRKDKFPLDAIVQDWQYWGDNSHWNAMDFLNPGFKRFSGTVQSLHKQNAKVMISIWPCFGPKTEAFEEMERYGHLYPQHESGWPLWARFYDPFHPEARQLYWERLRKKLWASGVDSWWMDATEPEIFGEEAKTIPTALGPGIRWLNAYPIMTTSGVYEGQRSDTDRKRVCILTRSAWAGQQRYGTVVWSGDISATWEVYKRQIAAGVNFSMAGIPWWSTDIGGFFTMGGIHDGFVAEYPGGHQNEDYRELYTRWFQFGAFSPVFRSHGTDTPREPWRFGDPGTKYYDSLLCFARLRYRLLPYLYSLTWKVTSEGASLMRGLVMDFPKDRKVHGIADQFMYGKEFLVSPVVLPLYTRGDNGGNLIPGACLAGPNGKKGGLKAEYFPDHTFGSMVAEAEKVLPRFGKDFRPPSGVPRKRFSIRLSGHLVPPETGLYELTVSSQAETRLIVGGRVCIDRQKGSDTSPSCSVNLRKGEKVALLLETSLARSSICNLRWRKPSEREWEEPEKARPVYLPAGAEWIDFWRGQRFSGGQTVSAAASIQEMPLFVRAGSILPLGPVVEHSSGRDPEEIEIRIYPGADGSFDLYEDEGDGYAYEQGVSSLIRFRWREKTKRLTIHERTGSFPGMRKTRTFRIVLVRPERGAGPDRTPSVDAVIRYSGKEITKTITRR
jgi:alpha-D-xyloside xylohydrolase